MLRSPEKLTALQRTVIQMIESIEKLGLGQQEKSEAVDW